MSNRAFADEKSTVGGHAVRLFRITCRCGQTDTFPPQGKPPIAAEQHFRKKGWTIGSGPKKDRCPDCSSTRPRIVSSLAELELPKESINMPAPELNLVADKPEQPTREERRIIFAKLEDVYEGEATGYSKGWSDYKVAADLNVPRAWVAMIRTENFGDAQDNDDVRAFMASLQTLREEMTVLTKSADAAKQGVISAKQAADHAVAACEAMAIRIREVERQSAALRPLVR